AWRVGAAAHRLLELAEGARGVTDRAIGLTEAVVEPGIGRIQAHGFLEMTQRGLASSDPGVGEAEIVMGPRVAWRQGHGSGQGPGGRHILTPPDQPPPLLHRLEPMPGTE